MHRMIGIIGCGNMGHALMNGFYQMLDKSIWELGVYDRSQNKLDALPHDHVTIFKDAIALTREADIIILAVKPNQLENLLAAIRTGLTRNKILISVAAGISLAWLKKNSNEACQLIRCMPTTTALAGHGIFAFCFSKGIDDHVREEILELFSKIGICMQMEESKLADFSALIGAGPAYVFACMQGLAQAGLTLGFTQVENRQMLIELFIGAGELAKLQPVNFAQLKDNVCSPAGLTIAGINVLDRAGLSGLMVEAVLAASKRAKEMEA